VVERGRICVVPGGASLSLSAGLDICSQQALDNSVLHAVSNALVFNFNSHLFQL